jgi:hypothetical protein
MVFKGSRRWLRASNIRFLFVTARCNRALRLTKARYLIESSKIGRRRIIGERVCPAKAGMFSGRQSHRGNSQEPRRLSCIRGGNEANGAN